MTCAFASFQDLQWVNVNYDEVDVETARDEVVTIPAQCWPGDDDNGDADVNTPMVHALRRIPAVECQGPHCHLLPTQHCPEHTPTDNVRPRITGYPAPFISRAISRACSPLIMCGAQDTTPPDRVPETPPRQPCYVPETPPRQPCYVPETPPPSTPRPRVRLRIDRYVPDTPSPRGIPSRRPASNPPRTSTRSISGTGSKRRTAPRTTTGPKATGSTSVTITNKHSTVSISPASTVTVSSTTAKYPVTTTNALSSAFNKRTADDCKWMQTGLLREEDHSRPPKRCKTDPPVDALKEMWNAPSGQTLALLEAQSLFLQHAHDETARRAAQNLRLTTAMLKEGVEVGASVGDPWRPLCAMTNAGRCLRQENIVHFPEFITSGSHVEVRIIALLRRMGRELRVRFAIDLMPYDVLCAHLTPLPQHDRRHTIFLSFDTHPPSRSYRRNRERQVNSWALFTPISTRACCQARPNRFWKRSMAICGEHTSPITRVISLLWFSRPCLNSPVRKFTSSHYYRQAIRHGRLCGFSRNGPGGRAFHRAGTLEVGRVRALHERVCLPPNARGMRQFFWQVRSPAGRFQTALDQRVPIWAAPSFRRACAHADIRGTFS
jgi:hypothetical protein